MRQKSTGHGGSNGADYLNKRAGGKMQVECLMYANEFGELAKSEGVEEWFTLLAQEQEQQI